jgi:hypothetical protein
VSVTFRIHFKGGPFGGETRDIEKSLLMGRRLRVPSLMTFPIMTAETDRTTPVLTAMLEEEYELTWVRGFNEYEARWIHPQEGLIRENQHLKKRLRELERTEAVLDALRELKEIL